MADTAYLASALATGAVLLGVWAFVARMENWRRYDPADRTAPDLPRSADASEPIGAWIAGFLALALVAGGGAVLLVSDAGLAAAVGSWTAIGLVFGSLLVGFLLWGTYSSARFRGLASAQAALLSAWVFGSLVVAGIAVKLVVGG